MKGSGSCYTDGEITSIGNHHSKRDHVSVTVAHGKRAPKPKMKPGTSPYPHDFDDRPTSSIPVHKSKAKHLRVGQKLRVGLHPIKAEDEEELF